MRFILFHSLLLLTLVAHGGGTTVVTVGSDGACDYSTIGEASTNGSPSGLTEIRVAKNYNLSSVQVLNEKNTTIRGGYDTCADSTPSGKTILNGDDFSGPAFILNEHSSSTSLLNLNLQDLDISGVSSASSGGVIHVEGSWQLTLNNVFMQDNSTGDNGGAIAVSPTTDPNALLPKVQIFGNSILSNNSATGNGGAIACEGGGFVTVWNTQMAFNEAGFDGGAVNLNDGCNFYLYGGGLFQGVIFNDAGAGGGGISASNDSLIYINSNTFDAGVALVSSNTATNGGGINVFNESRLVAIDATINNNSATNTGGGIRSTLASIEISRSSPGAQCHKEIRCSTVSDNSVSSVNPTSGGGGAIYTIGGSLEIKGTYIENNNANFGSAIRARFMPFDFDSNFTMIGNVIAKNKNAPQVIYMDDSSGEIAFTSFIDNEDMDRVIEMAYPSTSNDGNEVLVSGSIFDHANNALPSVELTTAGQYPVGDCNRNAPSATGDIVAAPRSLGSIVAYEDRAGGDYRLQENSTFVDFCNGSFMGLLSNVSANGLPKPVDNARSNAYGTYDLGGLERYDLDLIFKDNF